MERVLFLVERTGERITCLLNPESVVMRRQAGLRTRRDATGIVTGPGLSDDPLIATGGGVTEIELDLLFDVAIARELSAPFAAPAPATEAATPAPAPAPETLIPPDVRELTRPLWNLVETVNAEGGRGTLPAVRFIWGRAWNILGVVAAAAERLERFAPDGTPGRPWFRLRFRRISDTGDQVPSPVPPAVVDPDGVERMVLPVEPGGLPGMRIDLIAGARSGDPSNYRDYAALSGIDDPLRIEEGTILQIPPSAKVA